MASWNINNTYEQIGYNFAYYFVQIYNHNVYDLLPFLLTNIMMAHNENNIVGPTEILNYLFLSNIKNIDIPANSINVQPSLNGMILINLYGSYQQQLSIFSLSGEGQKNIIITMLIVPDAYGNYYLQNLIFKTKGRAEPFASLNHCVNMKF
jgi:hypothetical protein